MKISVVFSALGILCLACWSTGGAEAVNPVIPAAAAAERTGDDAATFAGQTDIFQRYLRLGELALENDDANTAADFFSQALSGLKDPLPRSLCIDLLHESLLEANRPGEADLLFTRLREDTDLPGRDGLLKLMNGRRMFFSGSFKSAVETLKELSAHLPTDSRICCQALELQGRALNLIGDFAGAQKCFADLAVAAGNNVLWQLKAWEGMIFNALDSGNMEEVKKLWQRMLREIPENRRSDFRSHWQKIGYLISCYEGNVDAVEPELRKAAGSVRPPDALLARIALTIADKRMSQKRYEEAAQFNDLALKFADSALRMEVLRSKIQTGVAGGALKQALRDLEQYLQKYPAASDRCKFIMLQGNLNCQLQNTAAAVECYKLVKESPEADLQQKIESALELGKIYQKTGEQQKALTMFEYAINAETAPQHKAHLMQLFGEYLYLLGRYNDAVNWFVQAAAAGGSAGEKSQLFLSQTLYQLKSYSKAAEALQKIINTGNKELQRKVCYLNALLTEKLSTADNAVKAFIEFAEKYPQTVEAPEALFQAAVLAVNSRQYEAWKLFLRFADAYPGENAANALYRAQGELLAAGQESRAIDILTKLEKNYPASKYTVGAQFRKVDHLKQKNQLDEALRALDFIEKTYSGKYPELKPQLLYDRALLLQQQKKWAQMLAPLEELTGKYADCAIAPQAFFLLGDLKSKDGKLEEALNAFKQARERSSETFFVNACIGRSADTAYALYSRTRQKNYLQMADDGYGTLLKKSDLPVEIFQQSLYKLSRCREDAGDEAGALRCCRELLYNALLAKRSGQTTQAPWSARALQSALRLLLKAIREVTAPEQADLLQQEAERLLKIAAELDLPGEDTEKLLEQIHKYRTVQEK